MFASIIFQIVLVLVGALISVTAALLDRRKNILLALGIGLGIFGLTAFWAGRSTANCNCDETVSEIEVTRIVSTTVEVTRLVQVMTTPEIIPPQDTSEWIICWHGTGFERVENSEGEPIGHEVLIAYPKPLLVDGLNLEFEIFAEWAGQNGTIAKNSLKMCQVDGIWYGENWLDWFPNVVSLQLNNGNLRVCSEGPGCSGISWDLLPSNSPGPVIEHISPTGQTVQVVGYIWSENFVEP